MIIAKDLISSRTYLLTSYGVSVDDIARFIVMLVVPSSAKELDSLGLNDLRC